MDKTLSDESEYLLCSGGQSGSTSWCYAERSYEYIDDGDQKHRDYDPVIDYVGLDEAILSLQVQSAFEDQHQTDSDL